MVALRPLPEERVYLVYENNARLRFPSKRKERGDEFVGLAVPLIRKHGRCDVDECRARFLRERFR